MKVLTRLVERGKISAPHDACSCFQTSEVAGELQLPLDLALVGDQVENPGETIIIVIKRYEVDLLGARSAIGPLPGLAKTGRPMDRRDGDKDRIHTLVVERMTRRSETEGPMVVVVLRRNTDQVLHRNSTRVDVLLVRAPAIGTDEASGMAAKKSESDQSMCRDLRTADASPCQGCSTKVP